MITKNTKASPVQVNKLKEELCEWKCLNCESEYYGPSAVEKGIFKCLRSECQGRYCVPKKYLANFINAEIPTIQSAQELAERLAATTRSIKELIVQAFEFEKRETGWLHKWLKAFSEVLISDLDRKTFADMFAQTLAYGFFAARIHHTANAEFSRFSAAKILPKTNPFLRKLFDQFAGVDMPETISWAVDEIVELLKRADMTSILKDFGNNTGKEDPVVHFYETFLACYDPKLRETRGVYYTPAPVVDYIVRSVDFLLEKHFGKRKGLADDKTLILDPAVGTASFLQKVVEQIHSRFRGNSGSWDSYVADNLLDRVFGFEILMAPYAVAHLKLGLQLQETGYKFQGDQRLGVFLTNTLEEAAKKSQELLFEWISQEANAASSLKKDRPIMVVLGNPPYSGTSANKGKWISELLKGYDSITDQETDNYFECDGEPLGERNSRYLNDDYVKFIRFSHWLIKQTGHGILAFITNHGFLDNPTFRGMRNSLMKSFDELYLLDLHGNSKKKETCPDGTKDENVFDIQQGVSICFLIRKPGEHERNAAIFKSDLYGARPKKYNWLSENTIESTPWKRISPTQPLYLFTSSQSKGLEKEYNKFWKMKDIFPINVPGFKTHRDQYAIAFTKEEMTKRIEEFRDPTTSNEELAEKYSLTPTSAWNIKTARTQLKADANWKQRFLTCAFRPFDNRWCYYDKAIMDRPRTELLDHVAWKDNLCILTSRQTAVAGYRHTWITRYPANDCVLSTKSKEANHVFPIFAYENPTPLEESANKKPRQRPNIDSKLISALENAYNWNFHEGKSALHSTNTFDAEMIGYYVYAILNSGLYRKRYEAFLKSDFPRIPFTSNAKTFEKISKKGAELARIHLMEVDEPKDLEVNFPVKGSNIVERLKFDAESKKLWINTTQYFVGLSEELYKLEIGGYQVLNKWLKERSGLKLSYKDIRQFSLVVHLCKQMQLKVIEIDQIIEKNGGLPFDCVEFTVRDI